MPYSSVHVKDPRRQSNWNQTEKQRRKGFVKQMAFKFGEKDRWSNNCDSDDRDCDEVMCAR